MLYYSPLSSWSCAAQAADVVRIGAPLALTGSLADEGKKQALAYDLWLTRVNAAGGIDVGGRKMKVELLTYDYQSDGKRAQQLAEKLITDDKVHVVMAPFGSGHTKIVAGVAERYGIPVVASVASSESVYDQGFKNLFGTLAPNSGLVDAMLTLFTKEMPDASRRSRSSAATMCFRATWRRASGSVRRAPGSRSSIPSSTRTAPSTTRPRSPR